MKYIHLIYTAIIIIILNILVFFLIMNLKKGNFFKLTLQITMNFDQILIQFNKGFDDEYYVTNKMKIMKIK